MAVSLWADSETAVVARNREMPLTAACLDHDTAQVARTLAPPEPTTPGQTPRAILRDLVQRAERLRAQEGHSRS